MNQNKRPKLVGEFIRKQRESVGLSQRELGAKFSPPVTTQFISNIERGITPLPTAHIAGLAHILCINERELTSLVEQEFSLRLSGKIHTGADAVISPQQLEDEKHPHIHISHSDFNFMQGLYEAYRHADDYTRQQFAEVCRTVLKIA